MKKNFPKKAVLAVDAAGLALLTALFVIWWRAHPSYGPAERALAALSAALFGAACVRFVPEWLRFWSRGTEPDAALCEPAHVEARVFFSLICVCAGYFALVYIFRTAAGNTGSFYDFLKFWKCLDSRHYLDIARDWYLSEGEHDRLVQLVFLPGYPVAVRLLTLVTGDYLVSGFLVSVCCFAAGGCVFYRLLRLDMEHRAALRGVKYLCLAPGAFFFAAPMSESLFFLLCVSCLYLARRGRWLCGCLCGALAAFTRSVGLSLLVPLVMELVRAYVNRSLSPRRRAAAAASLLLVPAGFGAYLFINYLVSGDPFRFMYYQREHWSQTTGMFFNTAAYQTGNLLSALKSDVSTALGLWLPNLIACFGALSIALAGAKRLRASYTAWLLAYFFVAVGATWLLSAPRYMLAMPPLYAALALLARSRRADIAVSACLGILSILYTAAFSLRWQVW